MAAPGRLSSRRDRDPDPVAGPGPHRPVQLGCPAAPRPGEAHRARRAPDPHGDAGRAGARRSLATGHASADESPGFLLWQVTNRWQAAQRAALKPFGLTHVQFVLLASLTWLEGDGPITQRRLAEHAASDPMMTSQVLRLLERRGLVSRTPHPD